MKMSGYCSLIAAALTFGLVSSAFSAQEGFQKAPPSGPAPQNPAGTVVRYRITDWVSVSTAATLHATQVTTITNQSGGTCGVGVDLDFSNGTIACTLNNPIALSPGRSVNICSRFLGFPVVNCEVVLNTCPGLNLPGGFGTVWSTTAAGCGSLAVSSRTIYTNAAETVVQGVSPAKIVKPTGGNIGD
jgi:hypothetical protein